MFSDRDDDYSVCKADGCTRPAQFEDWFCREHAPTPPALAPAPDAPTSEMQKCWCGSEPCVGPATLRPGYHCAQSVKQAIAIGQSANGANFALPRVPLAPAPEGPNFEAAEHAAHVVVAGSMAGYSRETQNLARAYLALRAASPPSGTGMRGGLRPSNRC